MTGERGWRYGSGLGLTDHASCSQSVTLEDKPKAGLHVRAVYDDLPQAWPWDIPMGVLWNLEWSAVRPRHLPSNSKQDLAHLASLSYQLNDIFVGGINNIVTIDVSQLISHLKKINIKDQI